MPSPGVIASLDHYRPPLVPIIPVVNVVCWSAGEVLLGKRQNTDAAGVWCTPGGKADTPGPLDMHACREVLEETGLFLRPSDLVALPVWHEYVAEDGQNFLCVYYATKEPVMRSSVRRVEPLKHSAWTFWHPNWLPQRMFEGDRAAVAAAASLR